MLGIIAEDVVHDGPVQEMPAFLQEDLHVLAAGTHVERFVDGEPGATQGQDHGQGGEHTARQGEPPTTLCGRDPVIRRRPVMPRRRSQRFRLLPSWA